MNFLYLLWLLSFFEAMGYLITTRLLKIKEGPGIVNIALGLIITSYFIWALAMRGWINRTVLLLVISITIMMGIRHLVFISKIVFQKSINYIKSEKSLFEKLLFFILLSQIGLNLFLSLTPLTDWDSLAYHLAIPKLIIQEGRTIDFKHYGFSHHPLLMEMVFTLCLLLQGIGLAKLLSWAIGGLTLKAIYDLAKLAGSNSLGLIAGLIFYSTQVVSLWTGKCYVDIPLAFLTAITAILAIKFMKNRKWPLLVLWAIFIAVLPGIKQNGVILSLIFLSLAVGFVLVQEDRLKTTLKVVSICLLIFVVLNSPWYYQIKQKESVKGSVIEMPAQYRHVLRETSLLKLKEYLDRWRFALGRLNIDFDRDGRIGPLFLVFIPLLIFLKPSKGIKLLLILSFLYISIFLFFKYLFPRYLLPIMPLLAVISAYSYIEARKLNKGLNCFLSLAIALNLIFNLGLSLYNNHLEITYLTGKILEEKFLNEKIDCLPAIRFINGNMEKGTVLLMGESRIYYLEKSFLLYHRVRGYKGEELEKLIDNYNITHILVNERIISHKRDIEAEQFLNCLVPHLESIYQEGTFRVYKLGDDKPDKKEDIGGGGNSI